MEVNKEQIQQLLRSSLHQSKLEPEQIPQLDLYIDQILMLFEDNLGDTRRKEKDKILTKSMVNNYSKEKLIRPMHGKKYTREQILQILLICNLKTILSIGDIKSVMTSLMQDEICEEGLSNIFFQNHNNQVKLEESIDEMIGKLHDNYTQEMDSAALVSLILSLSDIANYCKRTSEAIIDNFFTEEKKSSK